MSSIVTELLQSSGKLAKENIVLKVDDLKQKLEGVKFEVQGTLKSRYVDFYPQYVKLDKLIDRLKDVTNDYEILRNQIEKEIKPHMANSVAEFHGVLDDLKKIKRLKSEVQNLSLLHQHLENAKKQASDSVYESAAHHLLEFEKLSKLFNDPHQKDIAIICSLQREFCVTKEDVIYHLEKLWEQKITITSSVEGRNKKSVAVAINKVACEDVELLTALKLLSYIKRVLSKFGTQFLKLVCETVIMKSVKIDVPENTSTLTLTITNEQAPEPTEVFDKLKYVFSFLHENFFYLPLDSSEEEEGSLSTMMEFGAVIGEEFCTLVIEKCLKMAVPKQSKLLESFHKEIMVAENFCSALQEIGFFSSSKNELHNFIHNVDTLPVNKMAQDFLSRARSLMEKSLHQTVTEGEVPTPILETDGSHDLNEMARTKSGLSKLTFSFPRCQISASVKDIIKLLHEVKEEAKNIGPSHLPRLYYVSRSICELYCCVVPTYHNEEIKEIPQQTAIFHNNCMYLAHQLCILGIYFESELKSPIPMTFMDLVPEIRQFGAEAFLSQMRRQRKHLLQLLQEQEAYQNITLDDDGVISKAERSVRQCLCTLEFLKKVWSDVLPNEVYFKAIGTLFNTCLEEIILRILSMEDIAAEAAAQMDSIFSIFLKQGPLLFKISSVDKSNFVHSYVKRWFKFQELQLILSASLREIVDRWASGKGPLAAHFKSEEVKHLIRALFQNTERRAAALAKIK